MYHIKLCINFPCLFQTHPFLTLCFGKVRFRCFQAGRNRFRFLRLRRARVRPEKYKNKACIRSAKVLKRCIQRY